MNRRTPWRWLLLVWASSGLAACGGATSTPTFHAAGYPQLLSEWNMLFIKEQQLHLSKEVVAYDLNTPLFSDYAHKLRTMWIPDGTNINYHDTGSFDFPVGSIISKTFYYPVASNAAGDNNAVLQQPDTTNQRLIEGFDLRQVKLIETRLLVHRTDGWVGLPYIWNDTQTEAVLKRTGEIKSLALISGENSDQSFSYIVPNTNQCAGCHATNATTRKITPIGIKARHLNKFYRYEQGPQNQLEAWINRGLLVHAPAPLTAPQNALWNDPAFSLEQRARAYLDINCSHCHNKNGPADTSGLHLEAASPFGPHYGLCKPPIAAGTGTGDRKFDIVPGKPDESIFVYRLASANPAVMMPELGRSVVHQEGVTLVSNWIAELEGACE